MELYNHQIEGIKFLKEKKRAILADSMGLGKSRVAIVAAGETENKRTLVVCPASLKINWEREVHMVYPEDEVGIWGTDEMMTTMEQSVWHVVNYDQLEKHIEKIDGFKYGTIIFDEAHYAKNTKSKRSKIALALSKKAENVYLLTGTPIMNRPIELYNLLRMIRHPLGDNWVTYIRRYCGAWQRTNKYTGGKFWDVSGATHLDELKERMRGVFLRREKKGTVDLPEKVISNVTLELTPEQQKTYDTAWDSYIEFLENNPLDEEKDIDNIIRARHLVEIQKLKQVCSLAKVGRIVESVENAVESGEQVVVFTQYTETLERIKEGLKKAKIATESISGSDNGETRQRHVDSFQAGRIKVLVGNIKAMGVGITLTASSHVIFADMVWCPGDHEQAEDRCHRIGQNSMVNVYYYIIKDTLEEDILELLSRKTKIIKHILEGEKAKDVNIAKEVIKRSIQKASYAHL